jgi:hypothetical protein
MIIEVIIKDEILVKLILLQKQILMRRTGKNTPNTITLFSTIHLGEYINRLLGHLQELRVSSLLHLLLGIGRK